MRCAACGKVFGFIESKSYIRQVASFEDDANFLLLRSALCLTIVGARFYEEPL